MVGYRPIRVKGLVKLAHAGFSGRCQSDNSPHCQSDKFRQLDVTQFSRGLPKISGSLSNDFQKVPKRGHPKRLTVPQSHGKRPQGTTVAAIVGSARWVV
jgi:hypothetical protein